MNHDLSIGSLNSPDAFAAPTKMKAAPPVPGFEEETITYQRCVRERPGKKVSLRDVKKRRKEQHGGHCFLCGRAGFASDDTTAIGRLYKLYRTEYANHSQEELFKNMETFFREEIYTLYNEQGLDCPILDADQLKEHFLEHNIEPSSYVAEEIRALRDVATVMKANLFEENEDGNVDVNQKQLKSLIALQQQIISLYGSRLDNFNFYDPTTSVFTRKNKQGSSKN